MPDIGMHALVVDEKYWKSTVKEAWNNITKQLFGG